MTRAVALIFLLLLAVPGATPQAEAADLSFGLYVLGVAVADAVLSVDLRSPAYRIDLRYHTVGLASLVASDSTETSARGVFESGHPTPLEYISAGRLRGQDRLVGLSWRGGMPVPTDIFPPNASEREDVPVSLRAHSIDPLSSIVLLLQLAATTGRCDATTRTYDGRRAELFEVTSAGEEVLPASRHSVYSGRGLRCDFTDRTLAGARFGAGREDDQKVRHGTIWLSQVLPGAPSLPVRASVDTRWLGDAMIYLTAATP